MSTLGTVQQAVRIMNLRKVIRRYRTACENALNYLRSDAVEQALLKKLIEDELAKAIINEISVDLDDKHE